MDLKNLIRNIPDFPEKGIMFRDITTVLQKPDALRHAVDLMVDSVRDLDFDIVIGPESRGFIFGVPVAYILRKGFVPVRKPGKLPYTTVKKSYSLEYGKAELEIHTDAIIPGMRAVIIDDLLATGGTSATGRTLAAVGTRRFAFYRRTVGFDGPLPAWRGLV